MTMRTAKIFVVLFATLILLSTVSAPVSLTASVGNAKPDITTIEICDGTCSFAKALDPATAFTLKVYATDPNGATDINRFDVEFYTTADTNGGTADWDANRVYSLQSTASSQGCTEGSNYYCLVVPATSWTTKFLKGGADVFARVFDDSDDQDANESIGVLTVNATYGTSQDTTSGTYTGSPNTTANPFLSGQTANANVGTTHNGNTDINVSVVATNLTKGSDTITVGNLKWYLSNTYGSSSSFTGGTDDVQTVWGRGTDPTSATFDLWNWLDIPVSTPAGAYTGTYTYGSVASQRQIIIYR